MSAFSKFTLSFETNLFDELVGSIDFENIGKGRFGNHLVRIGENGVPIVRSTTQYNIPSQSFSTIHESITERINHAVMNSEQNNLPALYFNNALIEIYDNNYTKMNYHSDQNLDLDANSYIALFSCYKNPEKLSEKQVRKLTIKEKDNDDEFEFPLTHNSVILFSVENNNKFLHKITLNAMLTQAFQHDNKWLGITFRTSKTFIKFEDNLPYLSNGRLLELANEEQKTAFFKLRGQENRSFNFAYPELSYTLSIADRLKPVIKYCS